MGVGLHHAGILPSVKRLIEPLFERGLCKVVFATETMSLGIHMPAKSVVLQALTKRTDRGFRCLTHNELTQMAGRAGRRGIDPEGQCVIALDVRDGLEDMLRVVDGAPEPIESQFKLGYGSVALLLGTGNDLATIRRTRRVVVRPVPEPEAHPRRWRRRCTALETAVARRRARSRRPAATSRASAATAAPATRSRRARQARGRGGRRGERARGGGGARPPRARPPQGRRRASA